MISFHHVCIWGKRGISEETDQILGELLRGLYETWFDNLHSHSQAPELAWTSHFCTRWICQLQVSKVDIYDPFSTKHFLDKFVFKNYYQKITKIKYYVDMVNLGE